MAEKSAKRLATSQRKRRLRKLQPSGGKKNPGDNLFRVLIDANVWYSALLYGGRPAEAVEHCLKQCQLVISEQLMNEIQQKLKVKAKAPYRWRKAFAANLQNVSVMAELSELPDIARDPEDNHVLAAALNEACDLIITGDIDLLALKEYGPVVILNPADFLELLAEAS